MKIDFIWNFTDISEASKAEVEENMRNEIHNSYQDFEIPAKQALVSLHNDAQSNSIIGAVVNDKERIDMTISYSMGGNHATTYKEHNCSSV